MNQIENTFEISMFSVYYYGFICTTSNREENMSEERKYLTRKTAGSPNVSFMFS